MAVCKDVDVLEASHAAWRARVELSTGHGMVGSLCLLEGRSETTGA